jgi:hypothetical protein
MIASPPVPLEKSLAFLAFAAALASGVWWWQQRPALHRLQTERVAAELTGAAYAPSALPAPLSSAPAWKKPAAQSSGGEWIYELFTPPVIYYHAMARSFTVTPPIYLAEKTNLPFGLELLAVKREPFRLQLVGYVGGAEDVRGAFVSSQVPDTLLARAGRRFDQLGLAVKSLEVRKLNLTPNDPRPIYDVAAVAVVHDERTGTEVTLDTRGPKLTDTPLAVLRAVADAKARPRELHVGDTFQQDDSTFRIERIQLDPPEVVVAKQTAGLPYPETRVLKPETAGKLAAKPAAPRFNEPAKPALARQTQRP